MICLYLTCQHNSIRYMVYDIFRPYMFLKDLIIHVKCNGFVSTCSQGPFDEKRTSSPLSKSVLILQTSDPEPITTFMRLLSNVSNYESIYKHENLARREEVSAKRSEVGFDLLTLPRLLLLMGGG